MGALTDVQLKVWLKAGKPIAGKSDGNGLTFTLSEAGTAAWVYRYRFGGGIRREMKLARYPDTSLADARRLANKARADVDQGVDVAAERQHKKAEIECASNVEALANDWYAREIAARYKHPEVMRRVLDNDILPKLGRLDPAKVTPRQCDNVLRSIVDRGAPTTANDALRLMRRMFAFGRKRRYLEHNPVADFTLNDAGGKEQPRVRALSKDELAALFAGMRETPNLGRANELAFKLLLATCVRKRELVSARWAAIDLDQGIWHLGDTKTSTAIDIPLASSALSWFRELQIFAAGSEYVLRARLIVKRRRGQPNKPRFPHISPDTLNVALKRVQHGLEHFTVHDMRRTARTHLAALGVSREVAERALNHKLRGVEGIYNRHDYFDERRQALTLWAELLVSLERGEPPKVVPLRTGLIAMKPTIRGGKIRIRDAVYFIAEVVYPELFFGSKRDQGRARGIVRNRIKRAAIENFSETEVHDNDEVDAVRFYTWARNWERNGESWAKLQEIEGLPHRVSATARMQVEWDSGVQVEAKTYEELRPLYVEAMRKLNWQTRRAERLDSELRECRRKRKELSDKLSEAGKEGGRGNFK